MKKFVKAYAVIVFVFSFFAYVLYKQNIQKVGAREPKKFSIVCTTSLIADLVKHLVPNELQVVCLIGPGIDPHMYRPRARDVYMLNDADIIIHNGLHLEGKMADVLKGLSKQGKYVYAVSDGLLREDIRETNCEGVYDPHIWFDVSLWQKAARYIADELTKHVSPEIVVEISRRLFDFIVQLEELDEWIFKEIKKIPEEQRVLITAHDAFEYFGRRYGFKVHGLQGISTDSEVSLHDIQETAELIIQHKLPALFVEQTVSEKYLRGVQHIVSRKGLRVQIGGSLYSDALGEIGSGAHTYILMFKQNMLTIVSGLTHD